MKTADVVIVGGGIVGASIAWHLAQEKCGSVLMVEREPRQGGGSTGKATGGIRAQFGTEINVRMSLYSIRFFAEFKEHVGTSAGYLPYGYLFLALTDEEWRTLCASREKQAAAGLNEVELLSRSELAELVPQVRNNDVVGASFCPIDGFLDPSAAMHGFTRAAIDRGARLELETRVKGIETDERGVAAVVTSHGTISTRTVVNAAGPWAAEVARFAGVELPVTPLRRQLVAVDAELDLAQNAPMILEAGGGFHFRRGPWASDQTPLLMGGIGPRQKPGFDTSFDDELAAEVIRRAHHRLPGMKNPVMNTTHSRAGLYEMTPDHHAILGEAPELRGLFLANGFSGHGVMHSPATGRIVADLIVRGRSSEFDIAPLRPERFAEGSLMHESAVM